MGEWLPVTLCVKVAISLVAKGLKVTDMDGDIVGVTDGVAYKVDANGLSENVKLPEKESDIVTHDEGVRVDTPLVATGEVVRVNVVVTEGDPEGVEYSVLGKGEREDV